MNCSVFRIAKYYFVSCEIILDLNMKNVVKKSVSGDEMHIFEVINIYKYMNLPTFEILFTYLESAFLLLFHSFRYGDDGGDASPPPMDGLKQ